MARPDASKPGPLSVIVPTLNAEKSLPRLAASLAYHQGLIGEHIISDGGSHDATLARAHRLGWRVVSGERGRGGQLARGAAAAHRPWLLFLHADSLACPGWVAAIRNFMTDPGNKDKAAYFRFTLDAGGWRARWLENAVAWRCRSFALPYGDQGLLIHRDRYRQSGGYADLPIMEDVDLADRLGRQNLIALPISLRTGAARYLKQGFGRRILRNALCLAAYRMGVSPERIARFYPG